MVRLPVARSDLRLDPDPFRVVVKPFLPGGRNPDDDRTRVEHILDRVLALGDEDVGLALVDVRRRFADRHEDFPEVLRDGFQAVAHLLDEPTALSNDLRDLVGAVFLHEYAIEAAALTNPSIVAAPDQSDAPAGGLRIIVSLRAIGEGHISCIEFRTGWIDAMGAVHLDAAGPPVHGDRRPPTFDRALFAAKLDEVGVGDGLVPAVLGLVGDYFTMQDLEKAIAQIGLAGMEQQAANHSVHTMHWLAASNYELFFPPTSEISQRVIYPGSPTESHGMEDARFVRFEEPDGSVVHYATYTAYDGFSVLPQLIETPDFETFRIATLNGPAARNKGMALFPRRVGGRFAALGRSDNENNYVMFSDNVRFWHESHRIQVPVRPWELVQIGNCGPPMETAAGWLVLTHGVGPMRTYALGALLLDLEDPRQVLGHLREPLLVPDKDERDGYVPNVVYSCGSLIHGDELVLAYGASDTSTRFATVAVDALLGELTAGPSSRVS